MKFGVPLFAYSKLHDVRFKNMGFSKKNFFPLTVFLDPKLLNIKALGLVL
jgi:hypothetical protein